MTGERVGDPSRGKGRDKGPEAGVGYEAECLQCRVKGRHELRGLGRASTPGQERGSYCQCDQKALENQKLGGVMP